MKGMSSLHLLLASLFVVLATSLRINEFQVKTSQYERFWNDGIPRFGTLPTWYQDAYNDSTWSVGIQPIGKAPNSLHTR